MAYFGVLSHFIEPIHKENRIPSFGNQIHIHAFSWYEENRPYNNGIILHKHLIAKGRDYLLLPRLMDKFISPLNRKEFRNKINKLYLNGDYTWHEFPKEIHTEKIDNGINAWYNEDHIKIINTCSENNKRIAETFKNEKLENRIIGVMGFSQNPIELNIQ